jgi:hypothetical protein
MTPSFFLSLRLARIGIESLPICPRGLDPITACLRLLDRHFIDQLSSDSSRLLSRYLRGLHSPKCRHISSDTFLLREVLRYFFTPSG